MTALLGIVTGPIGRYAAVALAAFLAAWTVQGYRLDALHAKFDGFVAATKAEGQAATERAAAQEKSDLARKEHSDAENSAALAALRADRDRLLHARAGRSFLPVASTGAGSPKTACLDRAVAEGALRDFDTAVGELVDEGDEAIGGLNTARRWAMP